MISNGNLALAYVSVNPELYANASYAVVTPPTATIPQASSSSKSLCKITMTIALYTLFALLLIRISHGAAAGTIVGISIGVVAAVVVIAILVLFLKRWDGLSSIGRL
jgi:hypothetical protein